MIFTDTVDSSVMLYRRYAGVFELAIGNAYEPITEQSASYLKYKAERFIDEAHEFVAKAKESKKEHIDKAKVHALIWIGCEIVFAIIKHAVIIPAIIAGTAPMGAVVIGLIIALAGLVSLILAIVHGVSALVDMNKLKKYKEKLQQAKEASQDQKVKDKLTEIIDKIDKAT